MYHFVGFQASKLWGSKIWAAAIFCTGQFHHLHNSLHHFNVYGVYICSKTRLWSQPQPRTISTGMKQIKFSRRSIDRNARPMLDWKNSGLNSFIKEVANNHKSIRHSIFCYGMLHAWSARISRKGKEVDFQAKYWSSLHIYLIIRRYEGES